MRVVDVSRQSTNRPLTRTDCQAIKAAGNDGLIVGMFDGINMNPFGADTLQSALGIRGLNIGIYTALIKTVTGKAAVQIALGSLSEEVKAHLFTIAIDVELVGVTQDHVNTAIIEAAAQKQRPCIYSAYWFWTGYFNNTINYGDLGLRMPLWNANYNGMPDDSGFNKYPYGGWTDALLVGDQYQNTTPFGNFAVDYSYFKDEWVKGY